MSLAENLAQARAEITAIEAQAAVRGVLLRAPPEQSDPRTCCGRGCQPCMFTYYFDALDLWRAEAQELLGTSQSGRTRAA